MSTKFYIGGYQAGHVPIDRRSRSARTPRPLWPSLPGAVSGAASPPGGSAWQAWHFQSAVTVVSWPATINSTNLLNSSLHAEPFPRLPLPGAEPESKVVLGRPAGARQTEFSVSHKGVAICIYWLCSSGVMAGLTNISDQARNWWRSAPGMPNNSAITPNDRQRESA